MFKAVLCHRNALGASELVVSLSPTYCSGFLWVFFPEGLHFIIKVIEHKNISKIFPTKGSVI